MSTIFYTPCAAAGQIALRKAIYNQETRNSDSYLWLYKKMAVALASAGGTTLTTTTGAGFPSRTNKNSVYTTTNSNTGNTVRNLIPKPHLVSLKTSYAGDFGSVQKCEIAFTVYSLDQLNQCQGFFTINAAVFAKWGWTNAGEAGKGGESFSGNVVNFSWSINSSGGADCTCSAIGKGVNTLSINANLKSSDTKLEYKSGLKTLPVTSILERIRYYLSSPAPLVVGNPVNIPGSLGLGWVGVVEAPAVFKKIETPPETPPEGENLDIQKLYYASLGLIVDEFNRSLTTYTNIKPRLKIDSNNGGVCQIPNSEKWASANPMECLFPGKSKYGASDEGTGLMEFDGALASTYSTGGVQNVGYIMIEIEYLNEVMKSLGGSTDKGERSPSKTINDFFKKIFTMIDSNSGGAIKLSTAVNPKNLNEILIIETQHIPDEITPTEIPAVTQNSICRSMSLTAKVPSELQVVASVSANSGAGNVNSAALKPFTGASKVITPATTGNEQQKTETSKTVSDVDVAITNKKAELAELDKAIAENTYYGVNNLIVGFNNLIGLGGTSFGSDAVDAAREQFEAQKKTTEAELADLEKEKDTNAAIALGDALMVVYLLGPKPEYVSAARSYLRSATKPKNASIVYPLDFSFTIDGIAGIKFGDAVTTNYMPGLYKKKPTRCSFTVLSVEHNVSGNDWTTTCSTVFRMRP